MRLICIFVSIINILVMNYTFSQQLENLGENVNTKVDEISPVISPDGQTLYFVKSKSEKNKFYQDAWFTNMNTDGNFSPAKKMLKPFGSFEIFGIMSTSPDGNQLLLFQSNNDKSKKENGIYVSYKTLNDWTEPKKLEIINYKKYLGNTVFHGAFMSNNRKVMLLYFSKSSESKFMSLFVSFLNENGVWTEPKKLNAPINVNEGIYGNWCPFIASDDITLYFSSDRKGGYGDCDIYVTRRLDDSWLNWSKPENLGSTINSDKWDGYYSISAKGDYAYVVSSDVSKGLSSDIYRIELPKKLRPNPVVLVSGKVINAKNNEPLNAEIFYYVLPDGTETGIARSSPSNGEYKIVLPYGKKYSFLATNSNYYSISNYLDLSEVSVYKEMNIDIEMKPIEIGVTIRLNNIFFDFNESTLRPESYVEVDRVVKLLNENPNIEIELSGHTDNVGSDEYNNKLSLNRASSVSEYIISKGVNSQRIISKGYGKQTPVASNDSEEGRQLNRRVEFTILKK